MNMFCITATGKDLDSEVDSRFGRCQYFLFVDEKGTLAEAVLNPHSTGGGAGVATAQFIADKKAKTVITENVGPKALEALKSLGIEVMYTTGSVKKAIIDWIHH